MADGGLTLRGPRAWATFESLANGPAGVEAAA